MPHPASRPIRYVFLERDDPRPGDPFYMIFDRIDQRVLIDSDGGVSLERLTHMLNGVRRIGDMPSHFPREAGNPRPAGGFELR